MSQSFLLLIAAGIILASGYFLHQSAVSHAAKEADLKCHLYYKNQALEADMKADKDKDKIANEEQALTDADIIDALISLGIVRKDNDR